MNLKTFNYYQYLQVKLLYVSSENFFIQMLKRIKTMGLASSSALLNTALVLTMGKVLVVVK